MSAEPAALVRAFRVGRRTCTVTIPTPRLGAAVCVAVEWEPDVPRRLSEREMREYRAGRDAALAELGRMLGGKVAVVEL